jgi:glycine zipper-containing protein DUF883
MPYQNEAGQNEAGSSYPSSARLTGETGNASKSLVPDIQELGERARELGSEVSAVVKEHPLTTIAIAAGLAFAVGALWKIGRPSPQSQLAALRSRLPDLPSSKQLRAYWR